MRNCELEKDSFSIPFMIPLIPILVPITQKCAKNGQGIGNCDSLRIGIGPPLIGGRTERTRGVMIPLILIPVPFPPKCAKNGQGIGVEIL